MTPLTAFERYALEALRHTKHLHNELPPSAVGQALWEKSNPETRKARPSQQGLALLAGKFLRALSKAQLAHQRGGWYITDSGRQLLEQSQ